MFWANAIESSLLAQYQDKGEVKHWLRLTLDEHGSPLLSSRRLLNLIDGLRDDSRYKTLVERDGEFTEQELWQMRLFNELANMHHTLQAVNADPEKWEDYDPPRFLSRLERVTHWAEKNNEADEDEQAFDDFYADMGWDQTP